MRGIRIQAVRAMDLMKAWCISRYGVMTTAGVTITLSVWLTSIGTESDTRKDVHVVCLGHAVGLPIVLHRGLRAAAGKDGPTVCEPETKKMGGGSMDRL